MATAYCAEPRGALRNRLSSLTEPREDIRAEHGHQPNILRGVDTAAAVLEPAVEVARRVALFFVLDLIRRKLLDGSEHRVGAVGFENDDLPGQRRDALDGAFDRLREVLREQSSDTL